MALKTSATATQLNQVPATERQRSCPTKNY